MRKFTDKYLPVIWPTLVASIVGGTIWIWNFALWRSEVDQKINSNTCRILKRELSTKQVDLSYKQSSARANEFAGDALKYHFSVLKETQELINEIETLKAEIKKLNC